MEHQLRPPRGFVDIFNPFSLKNLESHTVRGDRIRIFDFSTVKTTPAQFIIELSYLFFDIICR